MQGTLVWAHTHGIAHSPTLWGPSVAEFRPERWLPKGGAPITHSMSQTTAKQTGVVGQTDAAQLAHNDTPLPDIMSFSVGQRDCVGQNLAKLELHALLATVLGQYRFELGPELSEGLPALTARSVVALTNMPEGGLPLKPIPRV